MTDTSPSARTYMYICIYICVYVHVYVYIRMMRSNSSFNRPVRALRRLHAGNFENNTARISENVTEASRWCLSLVSGIRGRCNHAPSGINADKRLRFPVTVRNASISRALARARAGYLAETASKNRAIRDFYQQRCENVSNAFVRHEPERVCFKIALTCLTLWRSCYTSKSEEINHARSGHSIFAVFRKLLRAR